MSHQEVLYTPYNGPVLLDTPLLNKGLAFTDRERDSLNLHGLLPHNIETIEEQTQRAWQQFCHFNRDISRHVFLRNIQDTNETLFYRLVREHLKETLPIIYTPTVGVPANTFLKSIAGRAGCLSPGQTAITSMRCCKASPATISGSLW